MVALAALAGLSFVTGVTLAFTAAGQPDLLAPGTTPSQAAAADRAHAATWITQQVDPDVSVSCDPQMCGQLRKAGFPAAKLTIVPPTADGRLDSDVVVATPALRNQFGARLAAGYAPLVIASFGSGADRVDIRVVAPDGAAAFSSQLAAERARLISAGNQLLANRNIQASPAARAALAAGQVDPRLLVTLSALAAEMPIRLVAFDDLPPGTSAAVQRLGADIGAASPAGLSVLLAFWHAQQAPYRPAVAAMGRGASGQSLVTVRFDAPSPEDVGGSLAHGVRPH